MFDLMIQKIIDYQFLDFFIKVVQLDKINKNGLKLKMKNWKKYSLNVRQKFIFLAKMSIEFYISDQFAEIIQVCFLHGNLFILIKLKTKSSD